MQSRFSTDPPNVNLLNQEHGAARDGLRMGTETSSGLSGCSLRYSTRRRLGNLKC